MPQWTRSRGETRRIRLDPFLEGYRRRREDLRITDRARGCSRRLPDRRRWHRAQPQPQPQRECDSVEADLIGDKPPSTRTDIIRNPPRAFSSGSRHTAVP
jgi:hypothetical protein